MRGLKAITSLRVIAAGHAFCRICVAATTSTPSMSPPVIVSASRSPNLRVAYRQNAHEDRVSSRPRTINATVPAAPISFSMRSTWGCDRIPRTGPRRHEPASSGDLCDNAATPPPMDAPSSLPCSSLLRSCPESCSCTDQQVAVHRRHDSIPRWQGPGPTGPRQAAAGDGRRTTDDGRPAQAAGDG